MSRNGSGVYSLPAGTEAIAGQTISSADFNTLAEDLEADANTARPVVAGGTGATNAGDALTNLGALPTDADLVAIGALGYSARSTLVKTAANTWSLVPQTTFGDSVLALTDGAGLRSLGGLVIGTDVQAYDAGLAALATYNTNGILCQTANNTFAGRTLAGTSNEIAVTNGDGVSGAPTLSLPSALTFTGKTVTGGTFANPTLSGAVAGPATFSGGFTNTAGPTTIPAVGGRSNAFLINNSGSGAYGVLIGSESATGAGWIQAQKVNGDTDAYALKLQPNGGDIIGNSTGPSSVNSLGYRGFGNLNAQNNAYTFVLADAGRNVYHSSGTHAFEIPPNSSVPFPIGTAIEILNFGGTLTITEGSGVTLFRWDGTSGTGTRTVGQRSTAVIQKTSTTEWIIMGAALT